MLIVCDSCGAEYEVELDEEETLDGKAGVRFRCSACGHTFSVGGDRAATSGVRDDWSEDPAVADAAPEQPPMLLKQEGKVYQVEDVATLQRWIAERRVLREDLLSIGGLKWEPVGSRRDLQVFFQLVDTVEKAQGAEGAAAPPVEGPAGQDHGAVQGAAPWEVGAGQGPPVSADTSWIDPFAAPAADEDEWEDDEGTDAGLPVFGAPPVAEEADPTDLPDRAELPNLAAIDAPEPTLEVPRHPSQDEDVAVGISGAEDAAEPDSDPASEQSVPSAASVASASDAAAPVPLPAAEADPTETVSVEDRATEEVRRPADHLSDDMLFPEERESEGLPPVPVAGGLPAGLGDRDLYAEDEATSSGSGVPPWAVAAAVVLVLVGAWWFLGRQDGQGGEEPVAAETSPEATADGATVPPRAGEPAAATADAAPGTDPAAEDPAAEDPAAEDPAAEDPAAEAASEGDAAAAASPGSGTAGDAAPATGPAARSEGAATLMPAPAPPSAAEREAAEAAAREAAAREAAAREAAAREAAAREAAEAAAREAAARRPTPPAEAASPPAPRATSVKQLVDRGWALVERGDLTGARASFSEALTKQPSSSDARFGLGYAYEKLGNQPAAVRNYCQVASDGSGDARIEAQGRLRALEASCE